MGDAEGWCEVPSKAIVDIVDDRRGYPRRLCKAEGPVGIPAIVPRRALPRYRRLDIRHECHTPLHPEIRSE